MLLLSLLNLLLNYDNLVYFIYELFAKIYFLKIFCIFSKNFKEKFDVSLVIEFKSLLNYCWYGVVSILVKHDVPEKVITPINLWRLLKE